MKFFFLLLLIFISAESNAQNWLWGKNGYGEGPDEGFDIASDANGNTVVTGAFYSSTIIFGTDTLYNSGLDDIYIVKYDANGNVLWARAGVGSVEDYSQSIEIDNSGNIYLCGFFNSPYLSFGSDTLFQNNSEDFFIVKYNSLGSIVWTKSFGGDHAMGITTDDENNVIVTGDFGSDSLIIDQFILYNSNYYGSPHPNVFLIKFDSLGNAIWVQSAGGYLGSSGMDVKTDHFNNIYLAGGYSCAYIIFGTDTIFCTWASDIFLAKYDKNGNLIWVKTPPGSSTDNPEDLTIDNFGNCILTGSFKGNLSFDNYQLINSSTNDDLFIAKYDTSGNVLWAKSGMCLSGDVGFGLATDNYNNIYLAGGFSPSSFDSLILSPHDSFIIDSLVIPFPDSSALDPMFIIKFNPDGGVLCSSTLISGGDDFIRVATDDFGNAYVHGDFIPSPFPVGSDTLFTGGIGLTENIFTAKFSCENNPEIANEINVNESLNIYPNPTSSNISFTFTSSSPCKMKIEITDAIGNIVLQKTTEIKSGFNQQNILLPDLSSGIYYFKLQQTSININQFIPEVRKIVVMH